MHLTRILALFTAFMLLPAPIIAEAVNDLDESKVKPVGMSSRDYTDPERTEWGGDNQRPLKTTIWYPTDASQDSFEVTIGNPEDPLFIAGKAQGNPAISEARERYPLILLSHGTGGAGIHLMWLATRLAENGYIVAAVNHHGNTAAGESYRPEGFMLWWERTRDLSVLLDQLLDDPSISGHIDDLRVGAAGFSLGGYNVISLAGGITSLDAFEEFCNGPERDATCDIQAEFPGGAGAFREAARQPHVQASLARHDESWRDDRFGAVYAIAPALGGAFTERGLIPIVIPVGILGAERDHIAPIATNAGRFAELIDSGELSTIDAGHYSFLSRCTETGRERLAMFCTESPDSRAEIHNQAAGKALDFFDRHLR